MARKQFTIIYPDRSKKHVGIDERDSLLFSRQIRRTANPLHFEFVGEEHRFRSFAELSKLEIKFSGTVIAKRYLAGQFTVVSQDGSRRTERLETEYAMVDRLERNGALQAA